MRNQPANVMPEAQSALSPTTKMLARNTLINNKVQLTSFWRFGRSRTGWRARPRLLVWSMRWMRPAAVGRSPNADPESFLLASHSSCLCGHGPSPSDLARRRGQQWNPNG